MKKIFMYIGPYDVPQEEDFSVYNTEGEVVEINSFEIIFLEGRYEVEVEAEWPETYTVSSFYKEKSKINLGPV